MASNKQIKELRSYHYVKYRSARSNRLRKFDSRVKLVAEVYSKRTHKRVGFLNSIKGGEPQARRFTNKARLIFHTKVRVKRPISERTYDDSFTINYNNWIPDQIPEWVIDLFMFEFDRKGYLQFAFRLIGKDNKKIEHNILTETRNQGEELSRIGWKELITNYIFRALRANQIRTSPKKYSKYRYWHRGRNIAEWHYIKKYRVRIILMNIG